MTENNLADRQHYAGTIEISKDISLERRMEIMKMWKARYPNHEWVALYTRDGGSHHNRIEFVVQMGKNYADGEFDMFSWSIIDIMANEFGKAPKGNPNYVSTWSMSTIIGAV